ncbi:excitatory amino acid transporter 3-like [Centroberyx gerrardi]
MNDIELAIAGVVLVVIIKPGVSYEVGGDESDDSQGGISTVDALMDLIRNMIPDNLVEATFLQYKTERKYFEIAADENVSDMGIGPENVTYDIRVVGETVSGMNIVGLIIFCIIFGVIIGELGEEGKALLDLFISLNKATKRLVDLVLAYMPLGILFLIAGKIVEIGDWHVIEKLGLFMVTVLMGLFIHATMVLPGIYYFFLKTNPYHYIWGMAPALLTAIFVSSSSATLPLTFQCCERVNKIDRRITRFMLPVGVTINMDGTALYEGVAALFIAQLNEISLSMGQLLTIGVSAAASSFGSSGIPAAGAVSTLLVLTSVDLPVRDVGLLIGLEWILDRCCTCVNVLGDSIGVAIVQSLSKRELDNMDMARTSTEDTDEERDNGAENLPQQL